MKHLILLAVGLWPIILSSESMANSVREIAATWRARSTTVHSLDIAWSSSVYHFLAADDLYSVDGELAFDARSDDRKLRCLVTNFDKDSSPSGSGQLTVSPSLYVFDGNRSVLFFGGEPDYPRATIGNGADGVGPELRILALRLFYFPFDPQMGVFDEQFTARIEREEEFDGEWCVLLRQGQHSVWVTADDRCLPVCLITRHRKPDLRYHELRVHYSASPHGQWRPDGWTLTRVGIDGKTRIEMRDATITRCNVNGPIRHDRFVLDPLPPGTFVSDHVKGSTYIVRSGKPNRRVLPGEFTGDNYDQLLNSDAPVLRNDMNGAAGTGLWLWISNGVLLAAIAGIWYWRSRRARGAADG